MKKYNINLNLREYQVLFHSDHLKIARHGMIYYIDKTKYGYSITDWSGNEYRDVVIKFEKEILNVN